MKDNIIEKKISNNNQNIIDISQLPLELNKYIYEYIPKLHCSQCYKNFVNYDIRYIYRFVKIKNMMFCNYYCAIKYKYYEYLFMIQWQVLIITLKINIFLGYIIVISYILIYILFIALINIVKMLILYTF